MKELKLNSIQDLKNEGKSFYWASFFLPRKCRINAGKLYSICRHFDNIADKDKEDRSQVLKNSIEKIKSDNKDVVRTFLLENKINNSIFFDLIEGLIEDQKRSIIVNKNELIKYCYQVAGTVGLMMSKIIGVQNKKAATSAIDMGIAMQLTNIVRDVFEDAQMNRIYIPLEWIPNIDTSVLNRIDKIKLEEDRIISDAIHRLIELSENFYKNGFSGLKYIPPRTRLGIFIAANIYRGIGIKIKNNGKKYLRKRIYLNSFEKLIITIRSIILFIFIPIINFKYTKLRDQLPNENL